MTRAARLLELMQALRRRKRPVTAAILAAQCGVSVRTLYRDIATLQSQGACIEGEGGVGYVLRPGFFLPPLAFTEDELDALLLGLGLVAERGDEDLALAAGTARNKIGAVLPQGAPPDAVLRAGPARGVPHLAELRRAIHAEETLRIDYTDGKGAKTQRVIWPILIGFFEGAEVVGAWCELRRDMRHFRLDRIATVTPTGARMPRRHRLLLAEWRTRELEDP